MAIRDALATLFGRRNPTVTIGSPFVDLVEGLTAEELYRTQPHLRTVISFVARNVAQLGLPTYQRVSDKDRRRVTEDPVAQLLSRPNPDMTGYELRESLVADLALYDVAYWMVSDDASQPSGWFIRPIPPSWVVERTGGSVFGPSSFVVQSPNGSRVEVAASDMLVFHGWNPGRPADGSSPVSALKQILAEQIHAWAYRQQIWQRGGRVGAYITRPAGAEWSADAREKFSRDWQSKWTSDRGPKAGGTPVLEDGMELKRLGFNAREEEWAEVSKLSLATVAGVYQVNPVMVGVLDNANYSNVREFRKMLYGETLGPILAMVEDRINAFLVPRIAQRRRLYVEFNIAEKLQGDFEEQASVLQAAVGAPFMSRNEARALQNLPSVSGGDALVTPLNVLVGGQASAQDSGSQNRRGTTVTVKDGRVRIKVDSAPDSAVEKAQGVLRDFFERQRSVVLSRLGSKADPDWWDGDRWDRELSDDLYRLAVSVATDLGREQAVALGFDRDDYDRERTVEFLRAVAKSRAELVNQATREQLSAAVADPDVDPAGVFDVAESKRTETGGRALMTSVAGFALVEAAKQLVPDRATKTWETGPNPRSEHAAMDQETVALDGTFSNGADWPGDPILGADGVANCNCGVSVSY